MIEFELMKAAWPGVVTEPSLATAGSAGFDLHVSQSLEIQPEGKASTVLIGTGLKVKIPPGYVGLVTVRSGWARKFGLRIANAPGVIDSDYRGEIKLLLTANCSRPLRIEAGTRVAQMVVVPCLTDYAIVDSIADDTDRGNGGFGSTGGTSAV